MVVGEASIHNIMGGMMSTGGVRLHNHKRKLKQRFDIIKKLGQGTYGKVQLGINKETGQEVAIKTIKKCKIETEADLIRIRREIQIMSSVQHPNIIHIYEVFENREKMVLVMEYAAGGELYDYLSKRKVLTEEEARRIFRQIATAVFYCHKHKICHRDLKLENILLDQLGNAKIADFGLSNVFDEQRLLNTFCGSPLYASPEIVKGTPYHGPEVDCWSLGVLLYTLVYGAMPFDGSNFKRLVKQISQSDYFEPKKPSPASPLIRDMLTVSPVKRADIERICTHWWVNEGYEQNCLDIAEELAAQTPVRLDLLLSLVPQSASAEKLVVGDQQPGAEVANSVSSETLVPTRCHSVGSLMELDRDNSDRRIRELLEEEPRSPPGGGDAKRKLETTPSMDETAAAGAKRMDRPKRKERREAKPGRVYKSVSRHHSAPIPNSITEEAMEVDPVVTVPIDDTADPNKVDAAAAACLDLIKECSERSPSKERSKTPVILEQEQPLRDGSAEPPPNNCVQGKRVEECARSDEASKITLDRSVATVPLESETLNEVAAVKDRLESACFASQEAINLEEAQRELKKLKEKALSLDSELPINESREVPAKTFERRRSKIFETAEKFNQMASSAENEKPKKIFIPGVNVGGAKRVFERKASLSSIATPPTAKAVASKVIIDVSRSTTPSTPSTPVASVASVAPVAPVESKRTERKEEEQQQEEEGEVVAEMVQEEEKKKEEAKKRAVDIITGAIRKPPVQKRVNGSPPVSPSSQEPKKLPLKIPIGTNDSRTATVSVSTPVETKFPFVDKATVAVARTDASADKKIDAKPEEPKMSSRMEITLKSATLPRPRKTSKAEISLSGVKPFGSEAPTAFKSEVEAKVDAFHPQRLRTQRSEVAFPVAAAVPHANRSSSLEPEGKPRNAAPKERIIPIQVETEQRQSQHSSTPPPSKPPPMPLRSLSQRSGSLSRQSTADSDTDSALGSTAGPEPIRKSPREYIIPIAVEGGGYVTPRSGSVEPESKASGTSTTANATRSRFGRPRRMSSLLSDASEDESPFSSLHRDSEDLLQRHMHRLRSSRPSRQPPEHADSLSSGEDDDDDGFELLTAENLFSTLLSRVRSLTQRLNVDDNRTAGFPSSRLFARLGSNSSQPFWPINKPLSRRLSESQFRHSLSRDADILPRKDSTNSSSNPGTPSSPGSHGASSRDTVYDIGISTLPRDKVAREDVEAEPVRVRKEAHESLEHSFTPSLARRLSRTLIEQTRRSLTRSPSASYESRGRSPDAENAASFKDASEAADRSVSTISTVSTVSDQSEHKERSADSRVVGRSSSLLEPRFERDASRVSPRRSVSLFDDESHAGDYDENGARSFLRESGSSGLSRWYKDSSAGKLRKESFRTRRADKIQEETTADDTCADSRSETNADNGSLSEYTSASFSVCDSNTNPLDATSSLSTKSYETSPTESSSNIGDYGKAAYKSDLSRNFEDRLLAAENLIRESKLRNLGLPGSGKFDPNLSSSYRDAEKCDARSLISIAETSSGSVLSKRRSCIPSLRLRSGSLTRDSSAIGERRKSFADSRDAVASVAARALGPEKSLLRKLFKSAGVGENDSKEEKEKEKTKQRRISRFLRPDFFDTPREESRYVKEKEAQKAAENERRKSRFIRRKTENSKAATPTSRGDSVEGEEKREKEAKNEINSMRRERLDGSQEPEERRDGKAKAGAMEESSRNGFLHSLEKKLERLRSADGQAEKEKATFVAKAVAMNGRVENGATRERSAPPVDCRPAVDAATIKRAVSVEDLSATKKSGQSTTKSRVSSVLGLFKTTEAKQRANSGRSLSKPKRSPTKSTKPGDAAPVEDASSSSCGSKIPTKHLSAESKPTKKLANAKRPDKPSSSASESPKRSPAKDAPERQDRGSSTKEKSASSEKESKEKIEEATAKSSSETGSESKVTGRAKKTNRSSMENGSSVQVDKPEDAHKKAKKTLKKSAGGSEGSDADGAKKKRIVRVVRKVTNKFSDGEAGRAALEEKDKSTKTRTTKKRVVESNAVADGSNKLKEEAVAVETGETGEAKNARQSKLQECQRVSRSNLKLDLSKIPQHSFRNSTPKSDSPKSTANDHAPDKLMECLSKVTHRASIAGSKIIIDKPLRAKDVAELKKEVTECARIIESHAECARTANTATVPENRPPSEEGTTSEADLADTTFRAAAATGSTQNQRASCVPKESPIDYTNELLSPMDEPESFDSWSISSTELSHARPDLHSPTSPAHSLSAKSDNAESVIDRIRRRSFYTRFNDRRRPSLTAPPPGVTLPSSATLPRKLSFAGQHREHRDRGKYGTGYGLATGAKASESGVHATSRSYSLYGGEGGSIGRDRSLDRSRYSDSGYSPDVNATAELVPGLSSSSSYDPLRRYLRSPTFDRPASRSRYHSADFVADPDLASCYRSPLISSMNDAAIENHLSTFSTLPRKYGSSVPGAKTVEYYEELLAPSCADYLPPRRTPASSEYLNKSENGYHNGDSELRSNGPKRKPYAERATAAIDACDACDDESPEQKRDKDDAACDAGALLAAPAEATIGRAGD